MDSSWYHNCGEFCTEFHIFFEVSVDLIYSLNASVTKVFSLIVQYDGIDDLIIKLWGQSIYSVMILLILESERESVVRLGG